MCQKLMIFTDFCEKSMILCKFRNRTGAPFGTGPPPSPDRAPPPWARSRPRPRTGPPPPATKHENSEEVARCGPPHPPEPLFVLFVLFDLFCLCAFWEFSYKLFVDFFFFNFENDLTNDLTVSGNQRKASKPKIKEVQTCPSAKILFWG